VLPVIDEEADRKFKAEGRVESDKYVMGGLPFAVFSALRDCRHMDNALMDTILEPDNVRAFLDKLMELAVKILDRAADNGVEGIMIGDDMGTQINLFFSPETFRTLFKPYYKKLADAIHSRGMDFFLHSCGKVHDIVGDLVEAGVDVFQFDQPELSGSEVWAREFGGKAVFYCPVDIQKIMVTGDKRVIEEGALNMVNRFKEHGGSLIAKDYPSWGDINVLPEWAQWARDIIIANAAL
jgi:uroporphyrinogen decarboxylase